MKRTIFGVLLVAACGFAQAADAKALGATCDALTSAVESAVKELSYNSVSGWLDDSAPRETNRQLRKVVASNIVQSNLALLAANKCAMPSYPVDDSVYRSAAILCMTAAKPKEGIASECDRSKWEREAPKR